MDPTLEEVQAELARREQSNSFSSGAKELGSQALEGAASGITGAAYLPLEAGAAMVNVPIYVAEQLGLRPKDSGIESPTSIVRQMFDIKDPPKTGWGKVAYNFAEGAIPSALIAGAASGGTVALPAGVVGGAINVIAKELGGNNPYLQQLIAAVPGLPAILKANLRQAKPKGGSGAGPITDPETGTMLSPGEASGDAVQLAREELMRRDAASSGIVNTFEQGQAATIRDVVANAQQRNARAVTNPMEVAKNVHSAWAKGENTLVNNLKGTSEYFKYAERQGGGRELIPTDKVRQTVDALAEGIPEESPNFGPMKAAIDRINKEYNIKEPPGLIVGESGQPLLKGKVSHKKISIEDMQTNLSAWAEAARSGEYTLRDGTNAFANVTPGQVKGMARRVLWAYKQDLDAAIEAGIPGAESLKRARKEYVGALGKLEEYQTQPLRKEFDVKYPSELVPETVVDKLTKLPSSQRKILSDLLEQDYPDTWQGIRELAYNKLRKQMTNEDGSFNTTKGRNALKSLESDEFNYLFPSKAEVNKARHAVGLLEHIERKTASSKLTDIELSDVNRAASGIAGMFGGFTGKYAYLTVVDVLRAALGSGNANKTRAYLTFNPQGQELLRYAANSKTLAGSLPKSAWDKFFTMTTSEKSMISGSAGTGLTSRQRSQQETPGMPEPTLDEIQAEIRRRENEQQP